MCWLDLREDVSSVGRCIGNTAFNHLSLYQEMKYCTWSGEGEPRPTPKPTNQTLRIQGKPLPFQTAVNSDSKTSSYCINMLHNSYTVSKIHKHMLTIFLRADHTAGAADVFLGTWWALPTHPFTALKEGERWGTGKPPVYMGGMCPGFLDRQSSQGCRFPFPASRWWSWLFFLHLLPLCPCPAHLTHSYLATWSLLPFCAVFSSTHPDFLITKL